MTKYMLKRWFSNKLFPVKTSRITYNTEYIKRTIDFIGLERFIEGEKKRVEDVIRMVIDSK